MKVILINGAGGSGKDTVVEFVKQNIIEQSIPDSIVVKNLSTIDKIKTIAKQMGWNGVKDEKGRQFLANLKKAWTEYNNGPADSLLLEVYDDWFCEGHFSISEFIIFIHCREPESIAYFIEELRRKNHIPVCSLLVEKPENTEFHNFADQGVNDFNYDIKIINNGCLADLDITCKDLAYHLLNNWNAIGRIEKKIFQCQDKT